MMMVEMGTVYDLGCVRSEDRRIDAAMTEIGLLLLSVFVADRIAEFNCAEANNVDAK